MPSTAFTLFQPFLADLFNGQNVPGVDALKLALSNVAPLVTYGAFSQITEIAPGGGYVSGGVPLVVVSSSQTGGVYTLVIQNFTLVATGGAIAGWRYPIIYDASKGRLIGFGDFGSSVTLDTSEVMNFAFDQINGLVDAVPSA